MVENVYSKKVKKGRKTGIETHIKADFKAGRITREKKRIFQNGKGINPQEDLAILNLYTPNILDSKYVKLKLTKVKGDIDKSTTKV